MRRLFVLLGILLLASACSALAGETNTAQNTTNNNASDGALVQWDRNPLSILFQADVVGGADATAFYIDNRVPLCTIYGDGRLVWVSEDETEVLFDLLDDATITNFVTDLTVQERFYTYQARANVQLPSLEQPITEQVMLNVNGIEHRSDSFDDWTPGYFERLVDKCIGLAKSPRIFQPSEGWLAVNPVPFDSSAITLVWDAEAAGLSLIDVLENPLSTYWLDTPLVLPIWETIRSNGIRVHFSQSGTDFQVVLHVPGVTVNSPPPPAGDVRTLPTEEPTAETGESTPEPDSGG